MTIGLDISVLSDQQKTGIAVYTYNLIDALLKINKKDKFILFGIATLETFDYLKGLPFKNYPNVEMKIYKMPSKAFRSVFLLWQKIGWPKIENFVGSVDIFHSFNWYLPPQKIGKIVGTVYDMTALINPKWHHPKTTQLDRVRLERMAKMADLVIAISQNSKSDFQKFWPSVRVEVVYPACDERFNPQKDNVKIRRVLKKYNLFEGYILSVSTLEPRKNLDSLIKAYINCGIQRKLVIVGGKGWKNANLFVRLNKYKQSFSSNKDRILMTGFVPDEDLACLYKQALCLIYPSFYEGFGLPVLEAMACGTPVIVSNTASLKEVAGEAAFFINSRSISDIKNALIKIESDSDLRRKLIKKGLEQSKKFSWDKSATTLNNLYHEFYS